MRCIEILPPVRDGTSVRSHDDIVPFYMHEKVKAIGGVGTTLRWSFTNTRHDDSDPIDLFFVGISDTAAFEVAMTSISHTAHIVGSLECLDDDPGNMCAQVHIFDARTSMMIVHRVAMAVTFREYIFDDDGTRVAKYEVGIERFDRSRWNFWNQSDDTAAPKQSWYKWDFSWMDSRWVTLPFTWHRLARNVYDEDIASISRPLRHHVAQHRIEAIRKSLAQRTAASSSRGYGIVCKRRIRHLIQHVPERRYVTAALTQIQTRELLMALVRRRFGCEDGLRDVFEAYIRHGYTSRIFGPYNQEANFVGHGKNRRHFKLMRQYDIGQLPVHVLNNIYQTDGTYRGMNKPHIRSKKKGTAVNPPRQMNNERYYTGDLRDTARFTFDPRGKT